MVKLRMTMPKKEEDIEKVMEEVMETHPEMAEEHHHHHHHHHHEEELLIVLNSLVDGVNHFNTRLKSLEERVSRIEKDLSLMVQLNAIFYKAMISQDPKLREEVLKKMEDILSRQAS